MSQRSPSFDLVVATVERTDELRRFLDSVVAQEYPDVRIVVVDQNEDDRLAAILASYPLEVERLRTPRGLSRARNAALPLLEADLVAFPDDDCSYPPSLLARIAERLAAAPDLSGLTGRAADASGRSARSWKPDPAILTDDDLWNRAISFAIFLRRDVVETVGTFDEELGLGSGRSWSSGEEIDYLVRAVRAGARVLYDPSLVVTHEIRDDDAAIGERDGASIGYLLGKHRYPTRVVLRMLVRPLGGALLSFVRLDGERGRYYLATFRGRVRGYRGAKRAKSSA